jgi:muramoyltetrapeptide carboxypeptidase
MSRYESKYPVKMKIGDILGVAAPSSPFDETLFGKGITMLNGMGFEVLIPDEIMTREGFLAGTDEQRVSVLHELFGDPKVKGIVCARGGYGSMRLLDALDFDLIGRNPKPFIGFSDVTALLNAIHEKTGLVCFHGPVVTSLGLADEPSLGAFESILVDQAENMEGQGGRVVIEGSAEGVLKGGNLATLCHLTGTAHAPDLGGSLLMLEDVGEAPYKIDRMLTQMKMAGLFEDVRGVVGGGFERCGDLREIGMIFERVFRGYGIPVVLDFPFGHGPSNRAFPIGVRARLDTEVMKVVME